MTKKLTFCALVKDNLTNVKRMVESLGGIFDEIIIVDTGSEKEVIDFEKKIATKFLQAKWGGDFAKVRNLALKHAEGDWVFTLDSDEAASKGLIKKIPELVKDNKIDGYKLPRIHYSGEKRPMKDYWRQLRLYRKKARYVGAIHESIKNLDNVETIDDFKYCIYHYNGRHSQREKSFKYSNYLKEKISEAQRNNDRPMVEYYRYKLWVQDNVYLMETEPNVDLVKLNTRYAEYEKLKKEIEQKIKKEYWVIKK